MLGKKILLSFVTLIVLLAAVEIIFRCIYPSDPESRFNQHHFRVGALGFSELNEIMEPDPDLFWRVKPNLQDQPVSGFVGTDTFLSFLVTTDEWGLRRLRSPQTESSLIFLGDSCTFGIGVPARETCAQLVGTALGLKPKNLSCPGYTIFQGRKLLKRMGWGSKPEALVVGFGFNDRLMWDGLTDPEQARLLEQRASPLGRKSRFIYCMELAVEGSLRLLKTNDKARRVPADLFRSEAEQLMLEAKDQGVPLVFLFWPRIEWMKEPGLGHPYAECVEDLADGKDVAILDLAEGFRSNGGGRLYLDGIHATPEGHALAAKLLKEQLEKMER